MVTASRKQMRTTHDVLCSTWGHGHPQDDDAYQLPETMRQQRSCVILSYGSSDNINVFMVDDLYKHHATLILGEVEVAFGYVRGEGAHRESNGH
jgi:hypothetical protein